MAAITALAAAVAGCGLRVDGGAESTSTPMAVGPTVSGVWVRPPQGMDRPAAGYMIIQGGAEADALISVKTDVAGKVEIHETTTDASGMSGMHEIGRLEIPAGGLVELTPGGYHLMLMQVAAGAIEVGTMVELELTFEKAGVVVIQAEVRTG